ncbi:MAG: ATP-binding cassette domain-containing protein, partial [Candidatus Aminicenantales bacterium]
MSVLKAAGISKSFNQRLVVNNMNISVSSAEIIGLLGRNGAGKTTTFQIIVGLIKPDRGSIYLDSQNISNLPTYRRALAGITYLPQEDSVFLKATVED